MGKWLIVVLWLVLSASVSEACQLYHDVIQDVKGNAIVGASVTIKVAGTSTLQTIYSDPLCATTIPNPVTTDSTGTFEFWTNDVFVDLVPSKTGYTFATIENVPIFSPLGDNIVTVANYTTTDICATGTGAIDQIGSTAVTLVINKPVTCTLDKTVPSTLKLQVMGNGTITIASGKTLTVYRPENMIATDDHNIGLGAGSGTLTFSLAGRMPVGWWGCKADAGTTNNLTCINKLIASINAAGGGHIVFGAGQYNTTDNFDPICVSGVKIDGQGKSVTTIYRSAFSTSGGATACSTYVRPRRGIFSFTGASNGEVTHLKLKGTGTFSTGNDTTTGTAGEYAGKMVFGKDAARLFVHDVEASNSDNESIYVEGNSDAPRFEYNYVHDGYWAALNTNCNSVTCDRSSISFNQIENNGNNGTSILATGQSVQIIGNHIIGTQSTTAAQVEIEGSTNFIFSHNIIEGVDTHTTTVQLVQIFNQSGASDVSGQISNNIFRNNTVHTVIDGTGVLGIGLGVNGTVHITGNLFSSNCNNTNGSVAGIYIYSNTTTAKIHIDGNHFQAGSRCTGTGQQTTGIAIAASASSNNVSIGYNRFEADVTTPYSFSATPLDQRSDIVQFYPAITFCQASDANPSLLQPTQVAANDWALARTAGGAETYNIICHIPAPTRTTTGAGYKMTAFKISQQITVAALTSNTFNGLKTVAYADNTANTLASYGGSITITMPTATQANPYLTSGTVGTPAFMNTANAQINMDFTVVMQNTGVYKLYGVSVTWTEQE